MRGISRVSFVFCKDEYRVRLPNTPLNFRHML